MTRRRARIQQSRQSPLEREIGAISTGAGRGSAVVARPGTSLLVAYRLQLTPDEVRAVEFARGRYTWADMLASHMSEGGLVAFTEPEMWQWCDDVDSDAAGGHSPFPLASPALSEKLQSFYNQRV